MNILPKKRWHVRTKDNIARVRRDEAKAAAELKAAEARALLAEQEARTSLLRNRARARVQFDCQDFPKEVQASGLEVSSEAKHVNFFEDLEAGETTASGNKEHESEKKKEQEEYEKKVGILTYLGQDTNELTGEKAWWQALPLDRRKALNEDEPSTSKSVVRKDALDPLNDVRRYLGCEGIQNIVKKSKPQEVEKKVSKRKRRSSSSEGDKRKSKKSRKDKKHKKEKKRKKSKKRYHSSTESSEDEKDIQRKNLEKRARLEKLRQERLEREKRERERTMRVLRGEKEESPARVVKEPKVDKNGQKYNNQFNPHLASQNKLNSNKKYWLE